VCDIVRGYTVVIAEIPLSLILYDGMVSGPAYDGVEDDALIAEWAIGVVTNGIAQEVAVASRVGEIVFAIVFVHPRGLEETMRIASLHGFAILVEHNDVAGSLCKLLYVIAHAYHAAVDGRAVGLCEELALVVGSCTKVDETVFFAIFANDGSQTIGQRMPPLELSAPESTKVAINLAIVILKDTRVDRE
jgi:hypothetical protein